jgi:4-hydroxy-2-oxoheptanedioate aldolase
VSTSAALKQRLARGESAIGLLLAYDAPWLIEVAGLAGCEYVVVDLEHEAIADDAVAHLIRAADVAGMPLLVRVPLCGRIGPFLSAGAGGVQLPHLEDAAHARELVEATRFAPLGRRSYYTQTRAARYGVGIDEAQWLEQANDDLIVIAMLESAEVIARLEDVLAVEGIDGFHIGTLDLAQSLGHPGPEEFDGVIADVVARCRAAGRFVGVGVYAPWNTEALPRRLAQGAQLFTVASAWVLTAAVTAFFEQMRSSLEPG